MEKTIDIIIKMVEKVQEDFKKYVDEDRQELKDVEDQVDKQREAIVKQREELIVIQHTLKNVVEALEDVKDRSIWVKRTIATAIIGSGITGAIGFIISLMR